MDFIFFMIIFTRICPPIGFLLNFLAIWLIFAKTPKEMAIHSRILLQTCIFDIIFLLLQITEMHFLARFDEKLIIVFYGYFAAAFQTSFGPFGLAILGTINISFAALDILLIVFQFTYRYFLLNRNKQISLCYLQLLFLPILLHIAVIFIFNYRSRENFLECSANEDIEYLIEMNMLGESCFLIIDNKLILAIRFMLALLVFCMAIWFSIIIFLRWRTICFVNAHAGFSENTKMLNKQLTRTLTLLAAFPFLTLFYLFLFAIFLFLSGIGVNNAWQLRRLQLGSLIMYSAPMVNPIITILTNTPYRRAIGRIFIFCEKSAQQIVPN